MEYTKNEDSVVFLKDTDIVQDIDGNNTSGDAATAVAKNGVASFDLVSSLSATSLSIDNVISANVSALCANTDEEFSNTSSYIDSQDELLSGQISTLSEETESLCIDLSNAITSTNDSISSPISGIALSISNEKTIRESQTSFLSGVISDDISTAIDSTNTNLATSAVALTTAIEAIRADVKGGVNYKGHLKLDVFTNPQDLSTYVSFLHGGTYSGDTITIPDSVKAAELNNGWLYYISISDGIDSYTTKDGIKFVPGNYIIVHAHNSAGDAADLSSVALSDLSRDNIDIIQVTDSDLVRRNELALSVNDLCGILSNAVSTLAVDGISASARAEFDSTSAWINGTIAYSLSTDYNRKFEVAANERSAICTDISNALTSHVQDFDDHVDAYENLCSDLSRAIDDVSSQTKAKVQISSYGNPTATSVDVLKINRMTAADYAAKVAADQILSTELYCITDGEMNAYGKKILSVAAPEDGLDAANKNYVDDVRTYASNISGAARAEFDSTSTYIGQVSTALCNTIKDDYALSADGKFVKLSVQTTTTLSNATAQNLTATTLSANSLSVVDSKTSNLTAAAANATRLTANAASCTTLSGSSMIAVDAKASALTANSISSTNLTATNATAAKISATRLEVADRQFALSTGDTAINIATQTGLADVRVNGIPVANTLSSLSTDSVNVAKAYSDSLSNALSGTAHSEIATALADAKDYTNDLSAAVDGKFTATSTYINAQDAAASANAYLSVKNGLSSVLDAENHLKLYINGHMWADHKMHNVLQSAALSDVGGQKAIVFTWNTASGVENTTSVLVEELVDIYKAEGTYIKLSSDSTTFYLDFDVLSNALGISSLSARATMLEGKTTTNETNISALQTSAIAFNANIIALQTSASTISSSLGDAITAINGLSTALTDTTVGVNAKIATNAANITTLSNNLTGATSTRIDTLQTSATSLNNNVIALQTSANTISSSLGDAITAINGLSTALTDTTVGVNAKIDTISGSLTSISANYATQASLSAYATTADYETAAVAEGKYVLTGAAWSTVSSNAEGLVNSKLTAYYTKNAADGKFVADDDLSDYYTKSEMSAYLLSSTAAATYQPLPAAGEKFVLSSEVETEYVKTAVLESQLTDYAKISVLDNYYTKDNIDNAVTGILKDYVKQNDLTASETGLIYTRSQLTGAPGQTPVLDSRYQKISDMTAYYNATSADSTFATKTAVNSGIVAKLSAIAESAVEKFADPSNVADISAVADKLNKLIDAVEEIRNILSSLTSIS